MKDIKKNQMEIQNWEIQQQKLKKKIDGCVKLHNERDRKNSVNKHRTKKLLKLNNREYTLKEKLFEGLSDT